MSARRWIRSVPRGVVVGLAVGLVGTAAVAAPAMGAGAAPRGQAPQAPVNLTVGDRAVAHNVEGDPRFGWWPQDPDPAEVQTAYRIEVAAADGAVVWDSGEIASAEQSHVGYAGPELEPGARYDWRVRTWDRTDQVSPWSAWHGFDTGLADEDWEGAEWIRRSPGGPGPITVVDGRAEVRGGDVTLAELPTPLADGVLELTVRPQTRGAGWVFRSPDRRNGYMWQLSAGGGLSPHVLRDGSFTRLATVPLPVQNGQDYRVRMELEGSTIRTFVDGELVDERTDDTFASGSVGFRESSNEVASFDDVVVTDATGAEIFADDFSGDLSGWANASGERERDEWTLARTEVQLTGDDVVRARAFVAGSQTWELSVDGERADRGQSFSYPGEGYYQASDVTQLVAGKESIALAATLHWYGSGQGRPAGEPGLLVKVVVEYADGTRQVVVSDDSWSVARGPYVATSPRNGEGDFIEHLDARAVPEGWQQQGFDDSGWESASSLGAHPVAPFTSVSGQHTRIEETVVPAVDLLEADDGTVVADFGVVVPARPVVRFDDGVAGRTVPMRAGYTLADDGRVATSTLQTQGTNMAFPYTQVDGAQDFAAFTHLAFRYLEIPDAGEDIAVEDVSAVLVHAEVPDGRQAEFSSSDPVLDDVWELMERSVLYSVQEQYVDTPTREKGQFLGDTANMSYATLDGYGERDLSRQAIEEFLASAERFWTSGADAGRFNAVYPNGDGKRDIPDYSLMMVDWVWRYYQQTGDRELLERAYPSLLATAGYVRRHIPDDGPTAGLVTELTGGSGAYQYGIVDWPEPGRFGYDMSAAARTTINAQSVGVLRDVAAMATVLEEPDADQLDADADALAARMNATLRRTDGIYVDGLSADGEQSAHAGQHATSYAISFGIAPEQDRPALAAYLAELGMRQGPMTVHRLADALGTAGRADALVDLMTDPDDLGWANILDQGGTFTWEAWTLDEGTNFSQSHGWSAQTMVDVQEHLLGVAVTSPGAGTVRIAPPGDGLTRAAGTLPTQRGDVAVEWRRSNRGAAVTLSTEVPVNVTARVELPLGDAVGYRAVGRGGAEYRGVENGRAVYEVGSGSTRFVPVRR